MYREFLNTQIDNKNDNFENFQDVEENEEETAENKKLKNTLGGKYAIQLKNNFIPRCLIPLENIFDKNNASKDPKLNPANDVIEEKNIGAEDAPWIIKLSKNFPIKEKEEYTNLMKSTLTHFPGVIRISKSMIILSYNLPFL